MHSFLEVARTGVTALLLHPLRSLATATCLLVLLVPYLAGLGLAQGIERDAGTSIRFGADLYVRGEQLGAAAPIPLALIPRVRALPGVTAVVPRIVGTVHLGRDAEAAVVVGMSAASLPAAVECVEGRLYETRAANELVVGTELAQRLNLRVGSWLPPFYTNDRGERVSRVVGIFRSGVSLWQSRLIFTSLETAAAIFNQAGVATDLLVFCRPGYAEAVAAAIDDACRSGAAGMPGRCRITTRAELEALVPAGLSHRTGIFHLRFLLAFAAAVMVVAVTSGAGLAERRREIGVLKATGWQTDEILVRGAVESFLLSLAVASLAVLIAFVWLDLLNGYGIAGLFLAGVGPAPSFRIPFRLAPLPALLGFLFAWIVVTSGTLYSAWRAATVAPREAMR